MSAPFLYRWDGEAMVPLPRFHNAVNDQFTVGETYRLAEEAERSQRSHAHYFACIHDAWQNLPEAIAVQFATAEHLRKHALIMCGFRDERSLVCSTKAEAQRFAAFLRPRDEYAIVSVHEATVIEWTAKSQSRKAMGNRVFQDSKTKVLDFLDDLLGIERGSLAANARAA